LAAPLAGLAGVSITLTILHYWFSVAVGWCLASGVPLLCVPTVVLLLSSGRGRFRPSLAAGAVLLAATVWGTVVANWTAIRAGEPTIACTGGTDQWGYAAAADWMIHHPGESPVYTPEHFERAILQFVLQIQGDRPAAFLLPAAAAVVRGTSAAFSYDWLCGIALAAGLAGVAGFFGTTRRGLVLLLAAGLCCLWLSISRAGFLGKLLAYPGCLLCAGVFLAAWTKPSPARVVAAAVLGLGVGLCLHPLAPLMVLVLVYGGGLAAQVTQRLFRCAIPEEGARPPGLLRHAVFGVCLISLMTGPWFAIYSARYVSVNPPIFHALDYQVLVALDLDSLFGSVVGATTTTPLLVVVAVLNGLLLLVAHRQGNVPAQACLLVTAVVPAAWLLNLKLLYVYQGLLFPLTIVGAVLLMQWPVARWRGWGRQAGIGVMALGLIAVRAPQAYCSLQIHLLRNMSWHKAFRQSQAEALRSLTHGKSVLLASNQLYPAMLVWAEVHNSGGHIRFVEPTWHQLFRNWVSYFNSNLEPAPPGRVDLLLVDSSNSTSSARVARAANLDLLAAGGPPVIACVTSPQMPAVAPDSKQVILLNKDEALVGLWNGTGGTASVVVMAEASPGPGTADLSQQTIEYQCNAVQGLLRLSSEGDGKLRLRVELAPGYNLLTWKVLDRGNGSAGLLLNDLRLDPEPSSDRPEVVLSESSSDQRNP
jgi:hypothetical protein